MKKPSRRQPKGGFAPPQRTCGQCQKRKDRQFYSSNQWQKGAGASRCQECVEAGNGLNAGTNHGGSPLFATGQPPQAAGANNATLFGAWQPPQQNKGTGMNTALFGNPKQQPKPGRGKKKGDTGLPGVPFITGEGTTAPSFGKQPQNSSSRNNNLFDPTKQNNAFGGGGAFAFPQHQHQPQQTAPSTSSIFGGSDTSRNPGPSGSAFSFAPPKTQTLFGAAQQKQQTPFGVPPQKQQNPFNVSQQQNPFSVSQQQSPAPFCAQQKHQAPLGPSQQKQEQKSPFGIPQQQQQQPAPFGVQQKHQTPLGAPQQTPQQAPTNVFQPAPATFSVPQPATTSTAPNAGPFAAHENSNNNNNKGNDPLPGASHGLFTGFPAFNQAGLAPAAIAGAALGQGIFQKPLGGGQNHTTATTDPWTAKSVPAGTACPFLPASSTNAIPSNQTATAPQNGNATSTTATGQHVGAPPTTVTGPTAPAQHSTGEANASPPPSPPVDLSLPLGAPPRNTAVVLPSYEEYNQVGINALLDSMKEMEQEGDVFMKAREAAAVPVAPASPPLRIRPRGFTGTNSSRTLFSN